MRAKETQKLGAIRLLTAAIKQQGSGRAHRGDDTQVLAIIEKMIKQRKDSISQFEAGGRARTWPISRRRAGGPGDLHAGRAVG
jgi:uncharacterized protein YqeY